MDPTQFKELLARLDHLSDKLGRGVDYFWPLAVKQVYVEFYVTLLAIVVSGIFATGFGLMASSLNRKNELGLSAMCSTIAAWLFCFLFVALVVAMVCHDLPNYLNPEHAALKSLLRSVK